MKHCICKLSWALMRLVCKGEADVEGSLVGILKPGGYYSHSAFAIDLSAGVYD